MATSNQLIPLDIIGTNNSNEIDISFQRKLCVYSIGSLIVLYNMQNTNKQFITYHHNPIALIKLLDNSHLISIDFSSSPMLIIWNLPSLNIATEFPIITYPNFKVGAIHLDRIKQDKYFLLITSIDCNLLYELNLSEQHNITFGFISQLKAEAFAIGFKCFNSSNDFALMLPDVLEYYRISDNNNTNKAQFLFRINFPFKLQYDTLRISPIVNIAAVLNEQGTCLLFDQNGNVKPSLTPFKQEMFSCCEFSKDSLLMGTANGKIYCYNIYDYTMMYYIQSAIFPKDNLRFGPEDNMSMNDDIVQDGPQVNKIIIDESLNMILIQSKDNSVLLSSISDIIKGTRKQFHFISMGVTLVKFAYSHFDKVTSIECIDRLSSDFYSCSIDQSLMLWRKQNYKWLNTYFDLEKSINSMTNNYSNQSINKVYLSVIRFHPLCRDQLYAGDNKGTVYLFDTNDQVFRCRKSIVGTFCIVSISFNAKCDLVSFGFDSGMIVICDPNNNCEFSLRLSDHIFNPAEIETRIIKGHIMSYSYFFTKHDNANANANDIPKNDSLILYLKSHEEIQISRLYTSHDDLKILYSRNETLLQFPDEILDLVVHTSEEYVIGLIKGNKIAIVEISNGDITGIIDLNDNTSYCYSLTLDPSGLFIGVVCNLVTDQELKSSLIIFEVGTGNVKTSLTSLFEIGKCVFALNGIEVIISGTKGFMSVWELPEDIKKSIENVLGEIKRNGAFWSQYEIKYRSDIEGISTLNKEEMINSQQVYNMSNINPLNTVNSGSNKQNPFDDINKETETISKEIEKLQSDKRNKETNTDDHLMSDELMRRMNSKNSNVELKGNDANQILTLGELKYEEEKKNVLPYANKQELYRKTEEKKGDFRYSDNQIKLVDNSNINTKLNTESNKQKTIQLSNSQYQTYQPILLDSSFLHRNFDYNQFEIKKENQFETIPKKTQRNTNSNSNAQPFSSLINQQHTFSNKTNSKNEYIHQQNNQLQTKTKIKAVASNKADTDIVINFNKDPNYIKASIPHNQKQDQQSNQLTYPNIKLKSIASSSEKQQNNMRMQNISKAINDILLPQKQTSINKAEPSHYEPRVTGKINSRSNEEECLNNKQEKDYYINNHPLKKTSYPEPEDIDDMITISNSTYKDSNEKSTTNNKPSQEKATNQITNQHQTEDTISIYNPISVTDDIDYLSDNIRNFENLHKIK